MVHGIRYGAGVLWLGRPPYVRWAIAAAIVVAAAVWDLRGTVTIAHPFAAIDIARGAPISEQHVVWKDVPRGLMPAPDLNGAVAAAAIQAGEPLTGALLEQQDGVPEDWWAVPVALPGAAVIGARVLLVAEGIPPTEGVVIVPSAADVLGIADAGLVAVPPENAPALALAALAGTLVTLLAP